MNTGAKLTWWVLVLIGIVVALFLLANIMSGQTVAGVCYASKCRSTTQADRFRRLTGWPHGRPGWVVNHMRPLRCHGADLPSNMAWQDSASAHATDRTEGDCTRYIPFDSTQLDSSGRAIVR